jgi:hypothetical protein
MKELSNHKFLMICSGYVYHMGSGIDNRADSLKQCQFLDPLMIQQIELIRAEKLLAKFDQPESTEQ